MKNKSLLTLLVCALAFGVFGTSCSDMLEPTMERYSEKYAQDSVYSAFGILMSVQKVAERCVILDESRSDLAVAGTYTTDSINSLINFNYDADGSNQLLQVSDFYHIINSCNFYLACVDTVSSKNGQVEMKRECAEVQTIRAWAYLQLVRLYGSVPFVTQPIPDAKTAEALEKTAPRINKDNVATYLVEAGLADAYEAQHLLGKPEYSEIYNGYDRYKTEQCFFPTNLVLADAYLMENKYEDAAKYYYDYFENVNTATHNDYYKPSVKTITQNKVIIQYYSDATSWLKAFRENSRDEKIVVSVGAANSFYGTVFNRIQNIYGFSTSVRMEGSGGANVGAISTTASQEFQQILPSPYYESLNKAQNCNRYKDDPEEIYSVDGGDARLYATAPTVEYRDGTKSRVIDKFCPYSGLTFQSTGLTSLNTSTVGTSSFNNMYEIPLYRLPMVWLRYAEAINRLGFPAIAFAVIKDGLYRQTLPTVKYSDRNKYYIVTSKDSETGATVKDTLGVIVTKEQTVTDEVTGEETVVTVPDTLWKSDNDGVLPVNPDLLRVPSRVEPVAMTGGAYYVSLDEMRAAEQYRFIQDFKTASRWNITDLETAQVNYGVHARGCGEVSGRRDTIFTYAKTVAKKVAEDSARINGWSYDEQLAHEATYYKSYTDKNGFYCDSLTITDKEVIINAVENIILDESALETAFEGHRFSDLVRVASHKSAAGLVDGTEWLAWKVARRANLVTDNADQKDESIYNILKDVNKWFLKLP